MCSKKISKMPQALNSGQVAGIEAAVHAVRHKFDKEQTEAVLLVDASNAFNRLNRANALTNIRSVCPFLWKVLNNIIIIPT